MPFEDFSKRMWKIVPPGYGECATGDAVKISISADRLVTVECNGKDRFVKATYNEQTNTIETDTHEIRLQIACIPKSGSIGGSWTAEDTSSGSDGDE
jgi:hypothetical protein